MAISQRTGAQHQKPRFISLRVLTQNMRRTRRGDLETKNLRDSSTRSSWKTDHLQSDKTKQMWLASQKHRKMLRSTTSVFYMVLPLEIEVAFSVVVRDVLYHLVNEIHLALREFSVLDVLSDEVAEDSAEILMAGI